MSTHTSASSAAVEEEVALPVHEHQATPPEHLSPSGHAIDEPQDRDERQILLALARHLKLPVMDDLAGQSISAAFLEQVPISYARAHGILGIAGDEHTMSIAFGSRQAWELMDMLGRYLNRVIQPVYVPQRAIEQAINAAYQQRTGQAQHAADQIEKISRQDILENFDDIKQATGHEKEDLLDVASRAPVIKLVNLMLFEAVKAEASDVHVQPYEDHLVIRMRIDGVLFDFLDLHRNVQEEILSRIKVMGRMNIAEKRLPQDGRATVQIGDRIIDLRIASLPTSFGERIVIRLLDKSARLYTLPEIGMPDPVLQVFRKMINIDHGLVLVTGPTGSGKSTTLYAALQELNGKELNILTLEDPIEYQLMGVSQTQINEKKGMTFASGLRSVLRQDPDIIMVGEIRDHETAVMAIQSALTGHLVFSTLHTNDAASAVTRLLDLGIEPYLVASSVVGVLAQRLVRKICPHCRTTDPATQEQLAQMGVAISDDQMQSFYRGQGCDQCRQTGYRGRIGIFEIMPVDRGVRQRIQDRSTASDIKQAAQSNGMTTLHDDGIRLITQGVTSLDEVMRVTMRSPGNPAPGSNSPLFPEASPPEFPPPETLPSET